MRQFFFLGIFFILFVLFNLPQSTTDNVRSYCVDYARIPFLWAGFWKQKVHTAPVHHPQQAERLQQLSLENYHLTSQLNAVYEWLLFDQRLEEQTQRIQSLDPKNIAQGELYWRDFFQRRSEELRELLNRQTQAVLAKVIYREPAFWGSTLWVDVGEQDNETLGRQIIAKNSPVVVGNSLVGVVEYVDTKKSRVRLITDSGCVPAVRAVRGKAQDIELLQLLDAVLVRLTARQDISEEGYIQAFASLKTKLCHTEEYYLAKGELHGSSEPLWRCRPPTLQGIGFNYNYADQEGPSRDLFTGSLSILQPGDVLVTTGMDGIFPPGLHVAVVTKVKELTKGDCAYSIEAMPSALQINDLQAVFVIPNIEDAEHLLNSM